MTEIISDIASSAPNLVNDHLKQEQAFAAISRKKHGHQIHLEPHYRSNPRSPGACKVQFKGRITSQIQNLSGPYNDQDE